MAVGEYMYAGARTKTLERDLLSETEMELLTSAKSVEEARKVLYDTYLAPFLSQANDSVDRAIDLSIIDAKEVLTLIAPHRAMLDIIWIKYDFHNLKTILKGRRQGWTDDEILATCFKTGMVAPQKLLRAYDEDRLNLYNTHLAHAKDKALDAGRIFDIDLVMQREYFQAIKVIAEGVRDHFITAYITLMLDLFNVKAALRAQEIDGIEVSEVFIKGGTFTPEMLASQESILGLLYRFGGEKRWVEAVSHLTETGKYNRIEKIADDYVTQWLQDQSLSVFTPAALFSFFHARKNNAQIIHAIITAKKAGMPERELRTILRRLHA